MIFIAMIAVFWAVAVGLAEWSLEVIGIILLIITVIANLIWIRRTIQLTRSAALDLRRIQHEYIHANPLSDMKVETFGFYLVISPPDEIAG